MKASIGIRITLNHIAQHKVTREEVEQVMRNGPTLYGEEIDERSGEERITELGHTDSIRVLFVVWTPRGALIRPVTAFEAPRANRDEYVAQFFGEE